MEKTLDNKVVAITGASSGIGKNSRILEKEAQKIFSNTKLANDFDSYEIKARD